MAGIKYWRAMAAIFRSFDHGAHPNMRIRMSVSVRDYLQRKLITDLMKKGFCSKTKRRYSVEMGRKDADKPPFYRLG